MVAVACIMLIMYFAMEVSYDSNVEYLVNSQSLNRVKAYYAAKSGMQLSLLRIKIYQQAQSKFGAQLGNSPMLDQIWKFPFAWPMPIPDELNAVDKDNFKKIFKESAMDSSYIVTIEDEGSKIDLNDLNSPSKTLQDMTKKQLLNIFEQKKQEDEEFAREYSNVRFEELINNIADWMSPKSQSLNGGDKRANYAELNQLSQTDYYPPNRAFRTIAELHMVPGMNDTFFDLLQPRITIYGMKGINPNLATKEVLKSLDPAMTDEVVAEIIKRRETEEEGGPFKCDQNGGSQDFWSFVQQKGIRIMGNPEDIPMTCDTVMNFKIRSTGEFAGATREITAIVMDLNRAATKIKSFVDKEKQDPNAPPEDPNKPKTPTGGNNNANTNQVQKGPPRIVFWQER
ncbi:general secretion pathway protein GspK [Bdellovibrio bacteriovorus]|uniref:General secretion pathway protein GspK n=2 Tax=Bdellovibrio bacteriovorus TaxID=959 RepID=A0A162G597_BDEBC|nr:general secretion pathway protein GspK [Bdellovibrio bacteriovorus]